MSTPAVSLQRTSSVESPVPEGEYEDIREPERSGGSKQLGCRFRPRRQRFDQERKRQNQGKRDDCADYVAQNAIELVMSGTVRDYRRYQQNTHHREKKPTRAYGKERRQRRINTSYGKERDDSRQPRFGPGNGHGRDV